MGVFVRIEEPQDRGPVVLLKVDLYGIKQVKYAVRVIDDP